MAKEISDGRKAAYYAGWSLSAVGLLLFLSTFVTSALHFGDFNDFQARTSSTMLRAVAGMVLLMVGTGLRTVGARGLAGSGIVLNPRRARRDLEPYSRMVGGMAKDALDETGIDMSGQPEQVVAVRCRACAALNPETANYCQKCGKIL